MNKNKTPMKDPNFRSPTKKELGKNYRLLKRGELLKRTDEVFWVTKGEGRWGFTGCAGEFVGAFTTTTCNYRRRVPAKRKTPKSK